MSTLRLLLALSLALAAPLATHAQEPAPAAIPIIESADVSGLSLDQLSPGLRQTIDSLAGQSLDRDQLNAIASRIESEQPDVVAAVRDVAQPDGRVRVVFLVARITEHEDLRENINARYVVEHVDVTGIPDRQIAQDLLDELQTLVGQPLDSVEADRLRRRLEDELPDYDVRRRVERGGETGRIRVIYEITRSERSRWLHFTPSRSKLVYHEDHGWSGVFDVPIGGRGASQVNFGFVLGNDDDLVEEYSGYRFRFENRKAGADRLGVGVELSRFTQDWREVTQAAAALSPDVAALYRTRITVEPTVTFAVTPHLRVNGGVSTSELKPLDSTTVSASEHANAFVAGIGYDQTWGRGHTASSSARRRFHRDDDRNDDRDDDAAWQKLEARYELRNATAGLDSDLVYRRHFGQVRFRADLGQTAFVADFRAGRIAGRAPLFERFTLGDSATLRGWNKYDLAPAGADRMWHQSVELQYKFVSYFVEAGSIWNAGGDRKVRLSTGFGLGFLQFGFPLNADNGDMAFILNARFGVGF